MNGFYIFLISIFPFLTAIIITLGVLWHKRRLLELKGGETDIDVIALNKKMDNLTLKIEQLEHSLRSSEEKNERNDVEKSM
ncbi:hypothetical protein [Evansella tamaricis]|uniref:Phage shock protein B n=1 Tax=Evansella tamaricis TaxID=2069301 RepID=A0ABS6JMN6_9BACI|nr:hypothetical protein [Evansella tamaricis]MBU9713690.1 hypothetical protein [Evansella tamaricis]